MLEGKAKVGMRIGYNAAARSTRGICVGAKGNNTSEVLGTVSEVGYKNQFGSELVRVKWDDGSETFLSPHWIRRMAWQEGGYTHGKRSELQKSTSE